MNILIIGGGGREHAFAWKIAQSPLCNNCYVSPGNAGTSQVAYNVVFDISNANQVKAFCIEHHIELVLVGPEAPLVDGLVDEFRNDPTTRHIHIIGPSAYGAQLEGSKAFAKKFMERHQIPTAAYLEVTRDNIQEGFDFLDSLAAPYVLKADGLAAGKGVLILDDIQEAKNELSSMIDGKFGHASATVVIEQFLSGIEFSVFALTDGKDYVILPEAKDYKRIGEGDSGLNTGGMGAISPVSFINKELWSKVVDRVIKPTIDGLAAESIDYVGFVFFGLINVGGNPFVIEYNCRMGDPETEVVIPRIKSDFVDMLIKTAKGKMNEINLEIDPRHAATVMLVSGGYPGDFGKGYPISIPDKIDDNTIVFHAGTSMSKEQVNTSGGRVIAVTSMGDDFKDCVKSSLKVADSIDFQDKYYRKDIGFDL